MSGIVGHMMYAVLGGKVAEQRKLPIAPIINRHYASYLAGAYLGCDVQTLPAAICLDSGQEIGYGSQVFEKSPITGGEVKPWTLKFQGKEYTPKDIHTMFYGRTHLVFGWRGDDQQHTVPWDHLADYLGNIVGDALEFYSPGERQLAYIFGWATHIVGDSLIKSIQPGIDLHLLNGKYTPQNRPIQDLITFHEIGRIELGMNWRNLMHDLAETPVESVQAHYMRLTRPRGRLAHDFPNAWKPEHEQLLLKVLAENRRYQKIRNGRLIKEFQLTKTKAGWKCDEELSRRTGGLTYPEMLAAADKANFRHAMWQMGEAVGDLLEQIVERQEELQNLHIDTGPTWGQLAQKWK